MKRGYFVLLSCILLPILLADCHRAKQINGIDKISDTSHFVMGSGGGVSGQYTQYTVFRSGKVTAYDFKLKKEISYSSLEPKLIAGIWLKYDQLDVQNIESDSPGNFTFYLHHVDKELIHKVIWSQKSENENQELSEFFDFVETILENRNK